VAIVQSSVQFHFIILDCVLGSFLIVKVNLSSMNTADIHCVTIVDPYQPAHHDVHCSLISIIVVSDQNTSSVDHD
jgi:hypothetical protein